jgi:energy-coupling factor transporter ATP-binding protein EcfA2
MKTLSTEEIGKSYGGRQVVRGSASKSRQGEVVGLLGPNGAGKTTSFYMIVGLVRLTLGGYWPVATTSAACRCICGRELWHQLPAAGAINLSEADGTGQYSGRVGGTTIELGEPAYAHGAADRAT